MADEITISAWLGITSGGSTIVSAPTNTTYKMTQTGTKKTLNQQTVGTSWEAVDLGDILSDGGTVGKVMMENLDANNSVEVATDNAGANKCGYMEPGETWGPVNARNFASGAIYVRANTAACQVMVAAGQL